MLKLNYLLCCYSDCKIQDKFLSYWGWGGPVCSDSYITVLGIRNEVRELPKETRVGEHKMQRHLEEAEIN